MKMTILFAALLILSVLSFQASADNSYKIVFETMDCSGNTGFATVGPDEIYKLGNGDCSNPEDPGKKLKQLLVHDGSGSYNAYTLTQEEAKNVMLDVKDYMKSRKGVLDRSNAIIITH
ncbi:MAG TPA: hypothetical protein EYG88_09855 [Desulfocapsa sulfexigens]|nr:hypothetical protein [Desulfocapsa sulfexigens]